jgi:hypothetical protein
MKTGKDCASCGKEMSRVVYGYPTQGLLDLAKENNWVLGGCVIENVKFFCRTCKVSWSTEFGFENEN